jgi:hypothetical protein
MANYRGKLITAEQHDALKKEHREQETQHRRRLGIP